MAGKGKVSKQSAPDMRKGDNKAKYGTVANRDATAPKGKANQAAKPFPGAKPPFKKAGQ